MFFSVEFNKTNQELRRIFGSRREKHKCDRIQFVSQHTINGFIKEQKRKPNKQSAISKDGVKTAIYVRVFTGDCAKQTTDSFNFLVIFFKCLERNEFRTVKE